MKELSTLATEHGAEHSLYHSSNLAKIYSLLGKKRHVRITKNLLDFNSDDKAIWKHVLDSLDKEIRVNEQISLYHTSVPSNRTDGKGNVNHSDSKGNINHSDSKGNNYHTDGLGQKTCHICGETGHVETKTKRGYTVINYHSCEKFVKMNPKERFDELKKKGLCLTP